ncbi:beta-N-acetylhexosaminidase [Snuella sedimenti]|uniref:beta-N-acetylhexosaminidase n=1 Tax=Snuella sedimenti TaxID=2798802 RepID=A0A8J7LS77_9FLAO|nr:beta-N-acetylhexosaminidase [Snuella sedimenti]MBJ6368130.1 beta-N-acetylhexosaminidase [Snuella sedimenti]
MKLLKYLVYSACLLGYTLLNAQSSDLKIIPQPLQLETTNGYFIIQKDHTLALDPNFIEAEPEAQLLKQLIKKETDIEVSISKAKTNATNGITISRNRNIRNSEGYKLEINNEGIHLQASNRAGIFYGIQTLAQLFPVAIENKPNNHLPFLSIVDSPRFEYRALMLDPARHFLPVEAIKKYIDAMASYKFNYLHLHLTDDHGWRIEIKKYPLLTKIGSVRKETNGNGIPRGGFYTQNDLKAIVTYAKSKHVEIIPEIDMPGHGMSILSAYPDLACFPRKFEVSTIPGVSKELLCAGKPEVYQFYEDVISEVANIFPNSKLHLGGDEAPLDRWRECSHCQLTMQKNDLNNEEKLMAHFFSQINEILVKFNKAPLLWYESDVESYPKNSTVFLWRNEDPDIKTQEIKSKGLQMINSYGRNTYFDYPQSKGDIPNVKWMSVLNLKKAYEFDPVRGLAENDNQFIKGVQGCVWGEYVPNIERAFYMTYPRALALSEKAWSTKSNWSWERFKKKLDKHLIKLLSKGVKFRPPVELYTE